MRPADADYSWSDSEDELEATDVETAVQLGVPDGPLDSLADLSDPSVSRIGGHPTFLAAPHPPLTHSTCKHCSQRMELLVQIWCPLEDSPNDRVLFIWGCANGICQRKEGSVRAWRELRYNKKYAEKLERNLVRPKEKEDQQVKEAAGASTTTTKSNSNPFILSASTTTSPLGLGSQIFGEGNLESSSENSTLGSSRIECAGRNGSPRVSIESDCEDSEDENGDALVAALQSASLEDSLWKDAPAYLPLYLSTDSEYLPPPPKAKMPSEAIVDRDDDRVPKEKDDGGWGTESYENSMEIDHVFERFSKRVSYEGKQCLRYELRGTPLPYASDKVFDQLFPVPPALPLPVTKSAFTVAPARKRTYSPASLPVCPNCGSQRVFECQLMPNLINVLRSDQTQGPKTMADEERRAEVLELLKGQGRPGRRGMEWGTCIIFSCGKDCALCEEGGTTWREEYVLVQWDE